MTSALNAMLAKPIAAPSALHCWAHDNSSAQAVRCRIMGGWVNLVISAVAARVIPQCADRACTGASAGLARVCTCVRSFRHTWAPKSNELPERCNPILTNPLQKVLPPCFHEFSLYIASVQSSVYRIPVRSVGKCVRSHSTRRPLHSTQSHASAKTPRRESLRT